ncbi:hypothetical protein HK12_10785 [Acetobacter orientalis]|uniref:Uncharacterized protein n=1 Tax=Acetobacter orientalis TaxID=146474 RepID=A0A251ZZA7_9PROT|nr:hypothetical protein HK12_10785 [Acetobacter orientalis]
MRPQQGCCVCGNALALSHKKELRKSPEHHAGPLRGVLWRERLFKTGRTNTGCIHPSKRERRRT